MKGLLVKDLRLMFTTKLVFVVIIMALLMSIFATDAPYILVLVWKKENGVILKLNPSILSSI